MRTVLLASVLMVATAHADTRVGSTALTLARPKAKATRLLAKKVEVEVVRPLTPCMLKLVVESQHTLFKRFTIEVGYQVDSSGAIKNGRNGSSAEIKVAGEAAPVMTKQGHVDITRRKSHSFDAKLDVPFEHGGVTWTLGGVVKIEDAACLWDVE